MPLKPQILKSLLFLLLGLISFQLKPQNIDLKVKTSLVTATGKLSGATIKIFKNGILDQKFEAGLKGKFSFFLVEPNTIYVLEIIAENHVPSKIEITTWVPEEHRAMPYTIVLESFELLQYFGGLNYKIMRDPVLKFSFSNSELNFVESYRASNNELYQEFYNSYKEKIKNNEPSIPFEGFQPIATKPIEPTFDQALNQALFYINKKEYAKAIELLKKAYNKLNYDEQSLSAIDAVEEAIIEYPNSSLENTTTENAMRLLAKNYGPTSGELMNALKLKKLLKTDTHNNSFEQINVLVLKGDLKKVSYEITQLNTILNDELALMQSARTSIDALNGKKLTFKQTLDQAMVLINNREYKKAIELLKNAYNKLSYDEQALSMLNALDEAMIEYGASSNEQLTTIESVLRLLSIQDLESANNTLRVIQNREKLNDESSLSKFNQQVKSKDYASAKELIKTLSADLPPATIYGSANKSDSINQSLVKDKELTFDESLSLALQYINKKEYNKAIEVLKNAYRKLNYDEKALTVLNDVEDVLLDFSDATIERNTIESALRMLAVNEVNAASQIVGIVKRKTSLEKRERGDMLAEVNKYIEKGDFKKAKELIDKLYRKLPCDSTILSIMKTVDEKLDKNLPFNGPVNLSQGSLKLVDAMSNRSFGINQLLGHVNELIKNGSYKQAAQILDSLYKKLPTDATILTLLKKVDLLSQEDLLCFFDTISKQVGQAEYIAAVNFYNDKLAVTELLKCNKNSFLDVCNILEANHLPSVKLSHFKIHFFLSCGFYQDALAEYTANLGEQKHQKSILQQEQNIDFIIDFLQKSADNNQGWAKNNEQKIAELEQDSFYNQTILYSKALLNRVDPSEAEEPSNDNNAKITAITAVVSILIVFLIILLQRRKKQKQKTE